MSEHGLPSATEDPVVQDLARLFRTHPAWCRAAARISQDATSRVAFRHRPGEAWRLVRRGGETYLERGEAHDPDLAFTFGRASVERLAATRGDVADFAIALFELIESDDPELHVDLRVEAPFPRLVRRGYVRMLLWAGPRLLAWGARHGVFTVRQLRARVEAERAKRKGE